ncbi:large conductance mechanosensitive channel protein MscL [Calycomorphotria hydatis]|uniref:Large-conductance mechanosensitive channel n=1 Tax=Calycomorphotria hydatis TaxID=2528027 RepID=A0A517TEV5_9PLAN|nr:large conductance mechanosensitive channel protein MscL [Calycomorphotria hydatis]QDT66904.1 Large-conductance mechanosensitive channel [Calycomorphotria hydatis]
MTVVEDFKKFVLRGNIVDMAIGFTVGAAFSTFVKSLVSDVIMPPIGLVLGGVDFSDFFIVLKQGAEEIPNNATLAEAQKLGAVTLNYGVFINNLISLFVVALAMYLIIRAVNRIDDALDEQFDSGKKPSETPANKKCPFCRETISYQATRCPHCTSELEAVAA